MCHLVNCFIDGFPNRAEKLRAPMRPNPKPVANPDTLSSPACHFIHFQMSGRLLFEVGCPIGAALLLSQSLGKVVLSRPIETATLQLPAILASS